MHDSTHCFIGWICKPNFLAGWQYGGRYGLHRVFAVSHPWAHPHPPRHFVGRVGFSFPLAVTCRRLNLDMKWCIFIICITFWFVEFFLILNNNNYISYISRMIIMLNFFRYIYLYIFIWYIKPTGQVTPDRCWYGCHFASVGASACVIFQLHNLWSLGGFCSTCSVHITIPTSYTWLLLPPVI